MSIEQLQLLLEAASAAGHSAFWLAVLYIGQGYLGKILFSIVVVTLGWMGTRVIFQLNNLQTFVDLVRREAGCNEPSGRVYSYEREQVLNAIRKGVEQ